MAQKSLISLKDLITLLSRIEKIYNFSNFEEKRKILNLLYSKMELRGKNCLFTIRKPVKNIISTGFHQSWLPTIDIFRTDYDKELIEILKEIEP